MAMPPRQPFQLPTAVTITIRTEKDGRITAHAIDFDLVSTADTRAEAIEKARLAIRSYVELGFLHGWAEDIRFPAPEKFWPEPGTDLEVGEPIQIMNRSLLVYSASAIENEHREADSLA